MTQTTTSTATIFPIELVNLDDMKQFHLAEKHCYSLLTHNRVRIEAADTSVMNDNVVNMSRSDVKHLLAWLSDLDASGQLQAEPFYYEPIKNATLLDGTPLSATFGTVRVEKWGHTEQHEFQFCSDRCVSIENFHCSDQHIQLDQAEVLQLLSWLREHFSVKQDLH